MSLGTHQHLLLLGVGNEMAMSQFARLELQVLFGSSADGPGVIFPRCSLDEPLHAVKIPGFLLEPILAL